MLFQWAIFRRAVFVLASSVTLFAWFGSPAWAAGAEEDPGRLIFSVVIMRHGVRSQVSTNDKIGAYAAQPWPTWEVAPGYLTPHGRRLAVVLGGYYRDRYRSEGLLSGQPGEDAAKIYFRADSDERTVETARGMAEGLLPGIESVVHAKAEGQPDALFRPAENADWRLAAAAQKGRIGDDPASVGRSHEPLLAEMQQVLFGENAIPAGKRSPFAAPPPPKPEDAFRAVDLHPVSGMVASFVEAFLLEYADAMPMRDVGWGRVTPEMITDLLTLHAIYFDLLYRTPDRARIEASTLASHLLATLQQATVGKRVAGAVGEPSSQVVVIVGHDGNVASLGGLLGLNWWIPTSQANPVFPAGGLEFELRRHPDGRLWVRVAYIAQTLEQMRAAQPLSVAHPPAIAPIFVPGCSRATAHFDAPWDKFEAMLRRSIDGRFVVSGSE